METLKNRNIYFLLAGVINGFSALLHLLAGQLDLVDPLLNSNMDQQMKTEWLGVWHMVSIILFLTSYYLVKYGMNPPKKSRGEVIQVIGILYLLFSVPFILSGIDMKVLAPQWILLLPIGILTFIGSKNLKRDEI